MTLAAAQTSPVVWNPADYAANSASQLAWARELIAKLRLRGDESILDVGCGDGKVTAEIARSLPRGGIIGVDSSPEMLRFARARFSSEAYPNLRFRRMDARQLRFAQVFDVLFSNATLHWVDDHPAFLSGAATCLRQGGRLVISCGGSGNAQDVFTAVRATMRLARFRQCFRGMSAPYFFHRPEDYEKWLPHHGFEPHTARLVEKTAVLEGRDGLAAWFRTTWLPYTQRVPPGLRDAFVAEVVDRYVARHPLDPSGKLLVRMVRLEIEAVKVGTRRTGTANHGDHHCAEPERCVPAP